MATIPTPTKRPLLCRLAAANLREDGSAKPPSEEIIEAMADVSELLLERVLIPDEYKHELDRRFALINRQFQVHNMHNYSVAAYSSVIAELKVASFVEHKLISKDAQERMVGANLDFLNRQAHHQFGDYFDLARIDIILQWKDNKDKLDSAVFKQVMDLFPGKDEAMLVSKPLTAERAERADAFAVAATAAVAQEADVTATPIKPTTTKKRGGGGKRAAMAVDD